MILAKHLEHPLAGRLVRPLVRAPLYDSDAAAWFATVEASGGIFSSPGYDVGYTKAALSNFFKELKSQGLWTSISELGVIGVGVGNLSAALRKAKFGSMPTLTNANFVSGDLTPGGANAGLKGDGSTKYLLTGVSAGVLSQNNASLWVYVTNPVIGGSLQGLLGNGFRCHLFADSVTANLSSRCNSVSSGLSSTPMARGINGFSRTGGSVSNWRINTSFGTDGTASAPGGAGDISVFARDSSDKSPSAISLYGFGTSIDLSKLKTSCDNLMASFGFTP